MSQRQKFSTAVRTRTLSLQFENAVRVGSIFKTFPALYLPISFYYCTILYDYESCFFLVIVEFVQQTSTWYHIVFNVAFCRFLGHSTQTDCGSCSVDPKINHPTRRPVATCERTGGGLGTDPRRLVFTSTCERRGAVVRMLAFE